MTRSKGHRRAFRKVGKRHRPRKDQKPTIITLGKDAATPRIDRDRTEGDRHDTT